MSEVVRRAAQRYLNKDKVLKTAGEVHFVKDQGGADWGWSADSPDMRKTPKAFEYNPKSLKPLVKCLRSSLSALGHTLSAYNNFTKIKSVTVSPDGNLGGAGYILKITDIRRQLLNCCEAFSAISDTLYDEVHADHWNPSLSEIGKRDRDGVKEVLQEVEDIREDPEAWAEEED